MKSFIVLILIVGAGYFGYQKFVANPLYGTWQADTEAMITQLKDTNVPQSAIDQFQKEYGQVKTIISKDSVVFQLDGQQVAMPYKTLSKNGDCTTMEFETKTLEYCVKGDRLEVHNQQNSMMEIYKKS